MAFVMTVNVHWNGSLNYITSKLTNGILEGINSKMQWIKRRARDYIITANFFNMIYLPVVNFNLITHADQHRPRNLLVNYISFSISVLKILP
jgi:hypothetical protein